MQKFFETLGQALEETRRGNFFIINEEELKDYNSMIELPSGYFLWSTRIIATKDTDIKTVELFDCINRQEIWRDYWSGIKAIAYLYLGKVEEKGIATIFWPYITGGVTGLNLTNSITRDHVLRLQTHKENLGLITLQHRLL